MTEVVIERFDTFNTKGFTDELIFAVVINQPIPFDYYFISLIMMMTMAIIFLTLPLMM